MLKKTITIAAVALLLCVCRSEARSQGPSGQEQTPAGGYSERAAGINARQNKWTDPRAMNDWMRAHADGSLSASRWSVSTNVGDWAALGTANLWLAFGLSRHVSLELDAKANPWTFNRGGDSQFENRNVTTALGARWWPWYVYSGWWFGGKAQYQQYNRGGIGSSETEEGDAVGLALGLGYAVQVAPWFNIDFGLGFWGGTTAFVTYACPRCGKVVDSGHKLFILPNEVLISAQFIF